MKTAVFHIKGTTPLMTHSPKGMTREGEKSAKRKSVPSAEVEAEIGTYRNGEGELVLPCIMFRQAIVNAGKGRKIGKTFATTLLKGTVFDPDRHALLVDPQTGELLSEYAIDERPVVIGKNRVLRARPRYEAWACDVALDYDEEAVTPDVLVEMLNIAGTSIGVGDYRPEKGGWFGRFVCTDWADV